MGIREFIENYFREIVVAALVSIDILLAALYRAYIKRNKAEKEPEILKFKKKY